MHKLQVFSHFPMFWFEIRERSTVVRVWPLWTGTLAIVDQSVAIVDLHRGTVDMTRLYRYTNTVR